MSSTFHRSGPWPYEYTLVEKLRGLGFPESKIQNMAYRQKFAICRSYEERQARKVAAQSQLTIQFEEV